MADMKKSANVGTQKVFDINLQFLSYVCRSVDIDHLMSHELAPLPMALFAVSGHMRISISKSTLKTYMTIKVSSRVANEEIEVTVIGGCALLWVPG